MNKRRVISAVVVSMVFGLMLAGHADAKKPENPGKPPKDPPAPVEGTIYYRYASATWSMDAEGANKTELAGLVRGVGSPSHLLHNGHRWFLQLRLVGDADGDGNYECQPGDECYPNGKVRNELFAVRDDGLAEARLTDQASLDKMGSSQWVIDPVSGNADGRVSWIGRRWDMGTQQVVAGGIYAADVVFDDATGDVTGLALQPADPLVEFPLTTEGMQPADWFHPDPAPDVCEYTWRPDGTSVAYRPWSTDELRILDDVAAPLSTSRFLTAGARNPAWSPDDSRVAFHSSTGIETIRTDGSERSTIVKRPRTGSVRWPIWSPASGHLAFLMNDGRPDPKDCPPSACSLDVYRVTDQGRDKLNLTGDVIYNASAFGWR